MGCFVHIVGACDCVAETLGEWTGKPAFGRDSTWTTWKWSCTVSGELHNLTDDQANISCQHAECGVPESGEWGAIIAVSGVHKTVLMGRLSLWYPPRGHCDLLRLLKASRDGTRVPDAVQSRMRSETMFETRHKMPRRALMKC